MIRIWYNQIPYPALKVSQSTIVGLPRNSVLAVPYGTFSYIFLLVIPKDDLSTVVFFPGFQLTTCGKGRFLYNLVRAGSQPALGRLPAIASGMDIMLLKVSIVVLKPFDTDSSHISYLARDISHFLGHLAPSFEMDFNSSLCSYRIHIDMFYFCNTIHHLTIVTSKLCIISVRTW